jgi:hypothetical protein
MARARFARNALAAAAATFSLAARAGAPPQSGAAELLDSQATSLMEEHRYAEACPKLAESDRIKPGTGVLLRLALCYELSGRTASAWSAFREAAARARKAGDAPIADLASRRADGLEPRLAKLVVHLPPDDDPAGIDVRLDGTPLPTSALGVDVPIDPGRHTVKAAAAGRRPFATTFAADARGGTTSVAVDLPPDKAGAGQRTAAIAAGGAGLACVVVGSILGIAALSNWNKARSECNSGTSGCSRDALDRQSVVNAEALGSTIAFTAGAAGLAGAAVLWWTAPPASGASRAFGLSVTGSF